MSQLAASAGADQPLADGRPSQISEPGLQNRTGSSNSPFVRGARDSPVKWQLLDALSLERAATQNKLIFLHIGYRACHFSHIMALESFSSLECAEMLNEHFVPIIVDREERPDIDTIYMNYVQAVSNVGGWPLNLFLTPELEPVFGGTFWAGPGATRRIVAEHEDETPDFLTILRKVSDIWREQEVRCRTEATEVLSQLREFAAEGTLGTRGIPAQPSSVVPPGWLNPGLTHSAVIQERDAPVSSELDLDQLEEAYTHIAGTFDPVYGGFGLAPKFTTPPKLAFLLHLNSYPSPVQDVVGREECRHATEMALHTLRKIRDGALRDHVGGGGFARCSVAPDWSVPNFEKLVVDNALLLDLYLDAWRLSGARNDSEFFDVVVELVDYLTSAPVALTSGGFLSSEAADSYYRRGDNEMREGAYYLWTRREFDSVLDAVDRYISPVAAMHWDVQEDGNVDEKHDPNDDFVNQNILRIVRSPDEIAMFFGISVEAVERYIRIAKCELKSRRDRERPRPELDDKVVTGWNGLGISALARAATALRDVDPTLAERCRAMARATVDFVKRNLWDGDAGVLYRIWRLGRDTEGFADDYAYLILGLLDLRDATGDDGLVEFAVTLQEAQIRLFHDPAGAFFSTTGTCPHTILRLKDGMDTSLPSTNAVSASNLFRLGTDRYSALARGTVNAFEAEILQHPWLFPGLLASVVTARLGMGSRAADGA
ncbi:hypothetical protein XA68_11858 [Ophiocordyceps unilateralis]|uniref:Spermatogenesis-associated protein 20-like TRX domain-containing protein n=1 Tax=Ophiocordyceps unilateralis TaxID=268505 RepID=A0A2A9PG02_OPHUN|nr:hypothetical protein XA68_11858 [Ophiocordyceps unilateralis]